VRKSFVDHRLLYRLKCSELAGTEFQGFFERIMARADKTFTAVKPRRVFRWFRVGGLLVLHVESFHHIHN
jgi:hypothetical protein